jgi:predicted DNA-binding protein YlxM (UPF0122 family)
MDRILEITLLYDFYGELLTQKQKNVFELYYQNDLSLGEIAEQMKITRQGVYDTLKRAEKLLSQYERTLCLVGKFITQKDLVEKIVGCVQDIEQNLNNPEKQKICICEMKSIAHKILEQ